MGSPIAQVASSTQPQGKGFASPQPSQQNPVEMAAPAVQQQIQQGTGKGSSVTYPGQGGQPKMGQPNMYPNTVGQWDNASIQPQQSLNSGGKGKG
jgi:hypothetical protein